jgi:hypothetical protein
MKTQKILLMLVLCVITVWTSHAQTYYYNTTQTIQGNGYSYRCESDGSLVKLYNSDGPNLFYAERTLKNGTPIAIDYFYQDTFGSDWMAGIREAQDLAHGIFTTAELNSFKTPTRQRLQIVMIINPDTGNVWEVIFDFSTRSNYANIPIEKYREIELAIKNNVTFQISSAGQALNYCITFFNFAPTGIMRL